MALENILAFKIACKGSGGDKKVSPMTCRKCPSKMTCSSVQALLGVEVEYQRKYKGTIIERGMMEVARQKKEVADFILGNYDEAKNKGEAKTEEVRA